MKNSLQTKTSIPIVVKFKDKNISGGKITATIEAIDLAYDIGTSDPNKINEGKEVIAGPSYTSYPSYRTENIILLSCKYCNFEVASKEEYDRHTINKHPRMPGYPDKNGRSPPS